MVAGPLRARYGAAMWKRGPAGAQYQSDCFARLVVGKAILPISEGRALR